jgi:hypothetical protein
MDSIFDAAGTSGPTVLAILLGMMYGAPAAMPGAASLLGPASKLTLASVGAQAFRSMSDAAGEAGDVLGKVFKKGGTDAQASSAANKTFLTNMGINALLETTIGPFSDFGANAKGFWGWLLRALGATGEEAFQEPLQDASNESASQVNPDGTPLTYSQFGRNLLNESKKWPQYLKESGIPAAGSAFLTQMLLGGLGGGGGSSARTRTQGEAQSQQQEKLLPEIIARHGRAEARLKELRN